MDKRVFWDRYLRAYDVLNEVSDYRASLARLLDQINLQAGERVLDAGSGTGNLSMLMSERGTQVTSIDFSHAAVALHREKDPYADVIQASLESPLPFERASFDVVTCTSVLFALSRKGAALALREFARVLRPSGRVLVTVMKPKQSKTAMLWTHLTRRWQALSLGAFLRELVATGAPLAKVVYYNYRMYGLARHDGYHRYSRNELMASVREAGFCAPEYRSTYGGHFHMVTARRATPASDQYPLRGHELSSPPSALPRTSWETYLTRR